MYDIQKLWLDAAIGIDIRKCTSCEYIKPVDCFNNTDTTCKLCRKLISLGVKHKNNLKMSPEVIHGSDDVVECKSCKKVITLDLLAKNSFECLECFYVRCLTEFNFYNELELNIRCINCDEPKPVKEFPIGRLVCRSCIKSRSVAFIH